MMIDGSHGFGGVRVELDKQPGSDEVNWVYY